MSPCHGASAAGEGTDANANAAFAASAIFVTRKDSGGSGFNFSELLGNAGATAIGTAYYADQRTAQDAASKLGIQLATDAFSNELKEFWPDIKRRIFKRHAEAGNAFLPEPGSSK